MSPLHSYAIPDEETSNGMATAVARWRSRPSSRRAFDFRFLPSLRAPRLSSSWHASCVVVRVVVRPPYLLSHRHHHHHHHLYSDSKGLDTRSLIDDVIRFARPAQMSTPFGSSSCKSGWYSSEDGTSRTFCLISSMRASR